PSRCAAPPDQALEHLARATELVYRQGLVRLVGHLDASRAEEDALEARALKPAGVGGEHHAVRVVLSYRFAHRAMDRRVGTEDHRRALADRLQRERLAELAHGRADPVGDRVGAHPGQEPDAELHLAVVW